MKTTEEMIEYALDIADGDEHAYVFVFYTYKPMFTPKERTGEYYVGNRMYKALCEGVVRFCPMPERRADSEALMGCLMTHIFFLEAPSTSAYKLVKSRWRSVYEYKEHKEPMGIYTAYGVERYEQY